MGKIGRNDPCPCGSGKKYKKCCMLKEKRIKFLDPLEVIKKCGWCNKEIPEDHEIFSLDLRAHSDFNVNRYAGQSFLIELITINKSIPVIMPTLDSEAKKAGKDMFFALCSGECALELKRVLNEEKIFFDFI